MMPVRRSHVLHPPRHPRRDPIEPAPVPPDGVVVQLIFHTSNGLLIVDGNGSFNSDGSLDITTSEFTAPDPGTLVQIIVYGPGGPLITEGTTGTVGDDGSLTIE